MARHFRVRHLGGRHRRFHRRVVLDRPVDHQIRFALLHKLWAIDYEEWAGAAEAWQLATIGGARAAGDADGLGLIAPGRRADLVLLDLDSHVFTPLNDPLRQVVFGSTTLAVDSVLVGGEWKVRGGGVVSVDEADVLARARELGQELWIDFAEPRQPRIALLARNAIEQLQMWVCD